MSFHVGQKVVCVDDLPVPGTVWRVKSDKPRVHAEYTISAVATRDDGLAVVQLVEQKRTASEIAFDHWYAWYGAYRFRPAITRSTETGMAVLKKIAADASKKRALTVSES